MCGYCGAGIDRREGGGGHSFCRGCPLNDPREGFDKEIDEDQAEELDELELLIVGMR